MSLLVRYTELTRYDDCPLKKDLEPGSPLCNECEHFISKESYDGWHNMIPGCKCGYETEFLKLLKDNFAKEWEKKLYECKSKETK